MGNDDYLENPDTDNLSIVIIYHNDYVKDENGDTKMRVIKVENIFDDFLNMLHE